MNGFYRFVSKAILLYKIIILLIIGLFKILTKMELLGVTLIFDWNYLHFCLKLWKYSILNHLATYIRCGIENWCFKNNENPITGCILTPKRSYRNHSKVQILSTVYVFQKMIQAPVPCDIALKGNARIWQKTQYFG